MADFDYGRTVFLTATAGPGWGFGGWSGGGCSGTEPCAVSMTQATTVTGIFVSDYLLTVTKAGDGSGTVTSYPAAIDCGATCSAGFDPGLSVTLDATLGGDSEFSGWSGSCGGTGRCTVSVTGDLGVTATFASRTPAGFACTYATNARSCTYANADGSDEIILGVLGPTQCRTQCESAMSAAGWSSGCWKVVGVTCVCRGGELRTHDVFGNGPGGSCN